MQQEQPEERVGKGLLAGEEEEEKEGCDEEADRGGNMDVEEMVKVCEENEEEEKKPGDEGEREGEVPDPPSGPTSSASAEDPGERSKGPELLTEATGSPDPPPQTQRHQPGGAQSSRWDKTIIEKIRSYYEAAAKAEDGEEEEPGGGASSRRRSSFSEIPSGLVKESVSQFNVGEERSNAKAPCGGPNSPPAPPSPEKVDQPISSLDLDAGTPAGIVQDQKTPDPGGSVREEGEVLGRHEKVHRKTASDGLQDQDQDQERSGQGEEPATNQPQGRRETSPGKPIHKPQKAPSPEPCGNKEPFGEPCREHGQRTGSRTGSSWTRNSHKDLTSTQKGPSSSGLIKTGRWSHHSRIVGANRVLFEAMGSDVAGIGLFEAGPVVDPVLMENSARILSRVQTLALMYSNKSGAMKVPLHQKQACTAAKPTNRQNRAEHLPQVPQTQTHSQAGSWDQTAQEKRTTGRLRSLSDGKRISIFVVLTNADGPFGSCPGPDSRKLLPDEAPVPGQGSAQQTGVFTLSRPRDFISALNRSGGEPGCGSAEGSQTSPDVPERQTASAAAAAATSRFRGHGWMMAQEADTEGAGGGAR